MACCCAPSTTSGAQVELVPMDLDREAPIKAPKNTAVSKKPGNKLNGVCAGVPEAPRFFHKYDGLLHEPNWGKIGNENIWVPDDRANGGCDRSNVSKEERLKRLLASFRPKVAKGIRLDVVDPSTQLLSQCMFKIDMDTYTIHLTYAFGEESQYELQDMSAIFKGAEFAQKLPKLEHISSRCIGIEFQSEYGSPLEATCLHFEDSGSRNDFFACVKIMQMTAANIGPSVAAHRRAT